MPIFQVRKDKKEGELNSPQNSFASLLGRFTPFKLLKFKRKLIEH